LLPLSEEFIAVLVKFRPLDASINLAGKITFFINPSLHIYVCTYMNLICMFISSSQFFFLPAVAVFLDGIDGSELGLMEIVLSVKIESIM